MHFISKTAGGPCSMCGLPATHKVGEEITPDEPCMSCGQVFISPALYPEEATAAREKCHAMFHITGPTSQRHNLTAYVCCACFTKILGPATGCPIEEKAPEWLQLTKVFEHPDKPLEGWLAVEMAPNGRVELPATVKYIEVMKSLGPQRDKERTWLAEGLKNKAGWMFVIQDGYDYPIYVMPNFDPWKEYDAYEREGVGRVRRVYSYGEDLGAQLAEERPFHLPERKAVSKDE